MTAPDLVGRTKDRLGNTLTCRRPGATKALLPCSPAGVGEGVGHGGLGHQVGAGRCCHGGSTGRRRLVAFPTTARRTPGRLALKVPALPPAEHPAAMFAARWSTDRWYGSRADTDTHTTDSATTKPSPP